MLWVVLYVFSLLFLFLGFVVVVVEVFYYMVWIAECWKIGESCERWKLLWSSTDV